MEILSKDFVRFARHFRIGASIMNLGFTEKQVQQLLLLYEGVAEKGGEFSVSDAYDIIEKVDKHNGPAGLKEKEE